MDWQSGMNEAIKYIEDNLDKSIDYEITARFICCSVGEFQRIFSILTGVSLSEYIRRRRLTLAACDLQNSNEKVIDIAFKYGYDSHASFTRAFRKLHNTSPSLARKEGVILRTYPRISFNFMVQGIKEIDYKIEEKDSTTFIGINKKMSTKNKEHFHSIWLFWREFEETRMYDILRKYSDEELVYAVSTYCNEPSSFNYMASVKYNGSPINDNLELLTVKPQTYAVFNVPKQDEANIGCFIERIYNEWLPSTKYKLTGDAEIECCKEDGTVILMPISNHIEP